MNLRLFARGKECQIRLPGVCNGDPTTTVLAHFRMGGVCSGVGLKSPDLLGAWACSACHAAVDSDRRHRLDFLEGVVRTQSKLIAGGHIKW